MYDFGGTSEENTQVEPEYTSEVPAETVKDTRDDAQSEEPSETTLVYWQKHQNVRVLDVIHNELVNHQNFMAISQLAIRY